MLFKIPVKPRSEVLTTSQTLNPLRFTNPEYTHWVATTAAQTHTLPTPSANLAGYVMALINDSSGSVVFSGTFVSGASITLTTKQSILIMCMPLSGSTHKWVKMGELGASTELTADELAGIQGGSPTALDPVATEADLPVKATGAELNTGTDDAKFATAKALADSNYALTSDIPVKASGAEINTGTDDAKFVTAKAIADSNVALLSDIPDASAGFDYVRTGLTGGTASDVDGIAYASLSDGHTCWANVAGKDYPYRWSAASAAAESSPWVIRADDDAGGAGRWILDTIHVDVINVNDAAAKATPIDADLVLVCDSADSNKAKKSTVAELRSTLVSADALGTVIAGLAAKASPIDADSIAICDSADTNDAKETTIAELRAVMLASDGLGTGIAALDAKATPIDADSIVICDSADTNNAKETTIAELKAVILSADNLGGAIAGMAAKASPIDADSIVICDSADTNDAKETTVAELRAVMLASDGLGTGIAALDAKATPIDADSIVICDSADTNNAKETTIAELKAVILSANNLGGAIAGMAAKASPIAADSIVICDSADTNDAKETTIAELGAAVLASDPLGTAIAALDAKATPIDADSIIVCDSADTNNAKETTIAELRATFMGSDPLGASIAALDAKSSPIAADSIVICDSADTNNAKEVTIAELTAAITAPEDWTWNPTWATATPEGMTITAKRIITGKKVDWWLHIISSDPGGGGGSLSSFEFENDMYPADVGTGVNWPVVGFHRKDTGAADTWTDMQGRVDVAAAAGADRKVYLKNPVVWADNEVTELFLSGSHYMA